MTVTDLLEAALVAFLEVGVLAVAVGAFDRIAPRGWVRARHSLALAVLWLLPLVFCFALRPAAAPVPDPAPHFVLRPSVTAAPSAPSRVPSAFDARQGVATSMVRDAGAIGRSGLIAVWALVSLGLAIRLGGDIVRLRGVWRRRRFPPLPVELSVPLPVHRSFDVRAPAYIGYGFRTIVVPEAFVVDDEARLLLEHEVAHAVRRDDWSELINRLILVLFWWLPPVYLLNRIIRRNREILCDAMAAEVTAAPRRLALALVNVAERAIETPALTLAAHPSPGMLKIRVQHLIDVSQTSPRSKGTLMRLSVILPLLTVGLFLITPPVVAQPAPVAPVTKSTPSIRAIDRAIYRAAGDGDLGRVRNLLAEGANANAVLDGDGTPLMAAAVNGHLPAVELLLAEGANPRLAVPGDGTPLIVASTNGHIEVIRRLVQAGAPIDAGVAGDGNPLIAAALRGRLKTVEFLLELGADPNAFVYGDETPLINAAQSGHVPVAEALVKAGAELSLTVKAPSSESVEGYRSPLSEAERRGHTQMVRWLKARGAEHRPPQ